MGQQIGVIEKASANPGMVRFEANRNLTGMGHEAFHTASDAIGPRPSAALARKLLSTGQVAAVHIYGNMITLDLAKGASSAGLGDVIRNLYQYWKPGMEMPVFEDVAPEAAAAPAAAVADGTSGPETAYLSLVPPTLVERSRAALAKWKANH
ncbi:MAG TPA: hypothetical protein PK020_10020 [Ilumatobacteraceae bacterium]|nr:hypothetical protein [Ilumatobacteraceae bacterium]HRB02386.1 hypothetical protein [Ilumatobacteraceae bacterium]